MKKQTIEFLKKYSVYPKPERESRSLDELKKLALRFKIELENEEIKCNKIYDESGIWEDKHLEILREAINYLNSGIKFKSFIVNRAYGKKIFRP